MGRAEPLLFRVRAETEPRATTGDLKQVWDLASALREVFDAKDQQTAARILNSMLAESGARPELTNHDGEPWHLHFGDPGTPLAPRLEAETAMTLAVLIADGSTNACVSAREIGASTCLLTSPATGRVATAVLRFAVTAPASQLLGLVSELGAAARQIGSVRNTFVWLDLAKPSQDEPKTHITRTKGQRLTATATTCFCCGTA